MLVAVVAAVTAVGVATQHPPRPAPIVITALPRGEWLRLQDLHAQLAGVGSPQQYDDAFSTLSNRCLDSDESLTDEIQVTLSLLQHGGAADANSLTVMHDLAADLPIGWRANCAQVAGGYLINHQQLP
ncbi:hypothetical protein GCM10009738_77580 [Kitasatospora viridis]|uniref:Uncharacterized protein n=1 Tax=Kitasatospora viridis TaxID=281105 RepID=A0A561UGN6_9ACTN|nr:hypothetical protein FHX73_112343 [Kitasatospora viridis]